MWRASFRRTSNPEMRRRWLWRYPCLLAVFALLLASPVSRLSDSRFAVLLTESLLYHRSFDLARHFQTPLDPTRHPGIREGGLPHQLRRVGDHVYYVYPPGGSLLSVPLVAASNLFGLSATGPDAGYDKHGEKRIQKILAALLMTAFAALVFAQARLLLPEAWSALVCVGAVFGTQVWSTASRALWSHTWQILLVQGALTCLLAHAVGRGRPRAALLATLLAWAYITRPTASLAVVAAGLYLALRARRALPLYLAIGSGWFSLFAIYSWHHYGQLLPPYFSPAWLGSETLGEALIGSLVSPNRGLLVFLPQLLFVAYLAIRYRAHLPDRLLAGLGAGVVLLHWLVISTNRLWWGGHSFGPRLMTDLVPWFVLLASLGLRAWIDADRVRRVASRPRLPRLETATGALLLCLGILSNGIGAFSLSATLWNARPVSVDRMPSRIWDWRDPQLLAWRRPERAALRVPSEPADAPEREAP